MFWGVFPAPVIILRWPPYLSSVGDAVGEGLGEAVGDGLGDAVGDGLGDAVGEGLGDAVGEGVEVGAGSPQLAINRLTVTMVTNSTRSVFFKITSFIP